MKLSNKAISPLRVVYLASIVVAIIWILLFGPMYYNDTPGYLAAFTNNLSQGRIDPFRTPLYPLLLGLSRNIFGPSLFPWIVMVLQYALFLISIKYLYLSAKQFLPNTFSLVITAFYALYPTFGPWSNVLLTESLELSFSVFLLYSCLKLIEEREWKYAVGVFLWVFLLLALRPSSVAFLPPLALTFFILLFIKNKRKSGIWGLISVLFVSIILLGYSAKVKEKTGVFTPSTVSIQNNYWIADYYGYLDREVDLDNADILEIKAVVKESILKNKKGWLAGMAKRFYDASLMPSLTSYTSQIFRVHPLYPINIGIVLLLMLGYFVLLTVSFRKAIPVNAWLLLFTSGSIIFLSIIGAQYEWNRLILPAQPMILIIIPHLSILVKKKYISRVALKGDSL